ncbi:MAG: STAS domain-containing protein [Verrucomicrobiales bacterium]|nr:STAS domain-containing protein [Verrucomicrobiales bacterium]
MEINVQPIPGSAKATCVAIEGRIDSYTVDRVEEELNSLIRIGSSRLICDLSEVEFISSSGFKAFRRIIAFAREQEGDLKFSGLSYDVSRLFYSVGFAGETGIYATLDEALEGFLSGSKGPTTENRASETAFKALRRIIGLDREQEAASKREKDSSVLQTQILPKDSSLKETVIMSSSGDGGSSADEGPTHFAEIEPVKIAMFPESAHFQNLSQLLGTIGSLAGFPSIGLVKLNVAVLELCRSIVKELNQDQTFSIEIDSRSPGFRVMIGIEVEDYNFFENFQPKSADEELSEEGGREWLLNYVDEVDVTGSGGSSRILLSLTE